jgi:hypothetical protein
MFGSSAVNSFSKCAVNLFPSTAESRIDVGAVHDVCFNRPPYLECMAVDATSRYALGLELRALIDRDLR